MAKYIIYSYQFAPIRNNQRRLFSDGEISAEEAMDKKQDIFETFFEQDSLDFIKNNSDYESKLIFKSDHIIVFKIANNKHISREENFKTNQLPNYPSCVVIIDNRHNIQQIAIEERKSSFVDTKSVAAILEATFANFLRRYKLHISIQREYQKSEFWDTVSRYPNGITMVRFKFAYPNLPRFSKVATNIVSETSKNINSKCTTLEYRSDDNENLELSRKDSKLNGLVQASADSGNEITIKARGIRTFIKTGDTTKSVEVEDLELKLSSDLYKSGADKLIEVLNSIK